MNRKRKRLVSGSLFAIFSVIGLVMPGSFIVETAGPALDVTGKSGGSDVEMVTISGGQTYESDTKLYMTTVSTYGTADFGVTGAQALFAIFSGDSQSIPLRAVYPKGNSDKQVQERNTKLMTDSQETAVATAVGNAGYPVSMKVTVSEVTEKSPAEGKLEKGDVLTSIAVGDQTTSIGTYADLLNALKKTEPKSTVTIGFTRDGQEKTVDIVTQAHEKDDTGWVKPGSRLGIALETSDVNIPVEVEYGVEGIGGPSAGMMFSLTIYDKLTPGSLGGDAKIAGTGTIAHSGDVGPIGGIQHKLRGAADQGVDYFLAPASNCAETIGNEPDGMQVFAVRDFDEAVKATSAIGAGDTKGLTTCADVVNSAE
ncbi:MAG: PDZ domain-containing protein [Actinomycetaceae bacterium]|nr:PDZ domain-containing protein [Actinomycetaceae bacterium]